MHTAKLAGKTPAITGAALAALLLLPSCVHEWPEDARPQRHVRLRVYYNHSLTDWDQYDQLVTRTDAPAFTDRYHFKIYDGADESRLTPLAEYDFVRGKTEREDFTTDLALPAGDYRLYVWSDWADATTSKSLYFKTDDFSAVEYSEPYDGNNELRDAFRGEAAFHIEDNLVDDYDVAVSVPLERPLARYEFISTDLREFIENEDTRGMLTHETRGPEDNPVLVADLSKYKVKMIYTGYMPSKFNNFTNKPVDSRTGMSYDAEIRMLDEENALLGFDYVMVNGNESSVAVALEVYDPTGELIGRTNTINVSTKRNRNTTVRGRFLTSKASGGVGINPDFDGDFNIEIK